MLKKTLLGLAITLTVANLAAGVAYAAACMTTNGTRHRGFTCASAPDGDCGCEGRCSTEEQSWVNAGSKDKVAEMEEVVN